MGAVRPCRAMGPAARKDPKIDAIIREMPAPLAALARELRRSIWEAGPHLREEVKWGAPVWTGRGRVLAFQVYDDHLNLGLWRGAELAKAHPTIEGTGKSLRHVKVKDVRAARDPAVRAVIEAAILLDEQG